MTTALIPLVILAGDSWCGDCQIDLWDGHEAGLVDNATVCLDCRTARLNEGDI